MSKRKLSPEEKEAIATAIQSGITTKDLASIYGVRRQHIGRVVLRVTGKTIWELRRNTATEAQEKRDNREVVTWYLRQLETKQKEIDRLWTIIDTLLKRKLSNETEKEDSPQSKPAPAEQA